MTDKNVKEFTEKSGQLTTTGRARTKKQFDQMVQAEKEGVCIFCSPEQWNSPPFMEGKYWLVKKNDYPYKHHQIHWVINWNYALGHLEDIFAVPSEAWQELATALSTLQEIWKLPAINFIMRFGDPDLRSSTIHHIHGHIQIPSDDVVPNEPPSISEFETASICEQYVTIDKLEAQAQLIKILLVSVNGRSIEDSFVPLLELAITLIGGYKIRGGGIVFRIGNRRYTNAKVKYPNLTIYAPDGTGRVHATFVPPRPGETKPICKATFCKGFEGEELEKLKKRMEEFARTEGK